MQIIRKGDISFGSAKYSVDVLKVEDMILEGERIVTKYKNVLANNCLLIMFNAELGAGKTHFVKGIAKALEINEIVKSPTYSLIQEYDFELNGNKSKLVHFDAWRLENLKELDKLGLEEYMVNGNIIAVEWAGATEEYFKSLENRKNLYSIQIQIEYIDSDKRRLNIYETK